MVRYVVVFCTNYYKVKNYVDCGVWIEVAVAGAAFGCEMEPIRIIYLLISPFNPPVVTQFQGFLWKMTI